MKILHAEMVAFATSTLKHKICAQLSSQGVDSNIITSLDSIFKDPAVKPFEGISSFYQQIQYCRHHFNLVVSYKYEFIIIKILYAGAY